MGSEPRPRRQIWATGLVLVGAYVVAAVLSWPSIRVVDLVAMSVPWVVSVRAVLGLRAVRMSKGLVGVAWLLGAGVCLWGVVDAWLDDAASAAWWAVPALLLTLVAWGPPRLLSRDVDADHGRLTSDPLRQVVVVVGVLLVAAVALTPLTMAQSGSLFAILAVLSIPGRGPGETPKAPETEGRRAE